MDDAIRITFQFSINYSNKGYQIHHVEVFYNANFLSTHSSIKQIVLPDVSSLLPNNSSGWLLKLELYK